MTRYPRSLQVGMISIMGNCQSIAAQMTAVLEKHAPDGRGRRLKWAAFGHETMDRLRSGLESHKSALMIVMELISVYVV